MVCLGYILILFFILLILSAIIITFYAKKCKYRNENYRNEIYHGGNNWQNNLELTKQILEQINYTPEEKKCILSISDKEQTDFSPWNDLVNLIEYRNIKKTDQKFPQLFITHDCYFRKFFISQVFVLSRFYKKGAHVLYISASNATFLPNLIELFPSYKWDIYYDIELSYMIKETDSVKLHNKEMTINEAQKYHNKVDIVISHHRPLFMHNDIEKYYREVFESLLYQSKIIKEISPKLGASLKFMLPFVSYNNKQNVELIKGKILWLPWTSATSTDGTLIVEAIDAKKNSSNMFINLKTIQDAYAMHNMIDRTWGYYTPPKDIDPTKIHGYDNCFDCTLEATVWTMYAEIASSESNLGTDLATTLMNTTNNRLEPLISIVNKADNHGRHPNLLPADRINYLINKKLLQKIDKEKVWQQYEKSLYESAQQYDEFNEETKFEQSDILYSEILTSDKNKILYKNNFHQNVEIAKQLLATKFKNMYTEKEQKFILSVSAKEWPLPSIWNSLKFYIPYRGNKGGALAHNLVYSHLGQRKLFLAELQALTRFLKNANDSAIVLYAGAAPSVHLPLLYELFPNVIWHLYDPAKFAIKESKNAYIYNEFFTNDTAKQWSQKCDIFVCDIRLSAENRDDFEKQVDSDMKIQDEWTRIIQPKLGASLKFRLPYLSANNQMHFYKYIRGQILWQMWPPQGSTECRLIADAKDITFNKKGIHPPPMKIDVVKYQNACMEHNIIDRAWKTYKVPHPDCQQIYGYDRCFDCTCEAINWLAYMKLPNAKKRTIYDHFNALTKITHQPLCGKKTPHGQNQFECAAIRLDLISKK